MAHPIVEQLRFTRSEWARALRGVSEEDANRHLGQMNSIGWSTPSLKAMRAAWRKITKEADANLDSLTTRALMRDLPRGGKPSGQAHADALRRLTFHYWFHIGEILAIRQMLGQKGLPEYVGNLEAMAAYRPDK